MGWRLAMNGKDYYYEKPQIISTNHAFDRYCERIKKTGSYNPKIHTKTWYNMEIRNLLWQEETMLGVTADGTMFGMINDIAALVIKDENNEAFKVVTIYDREMAEKKITKKEKAPWNIIPPRQPLNIRY